MRRKSISGIGLGDPPTLCADLQQALRLPVAVLTGICKNLLHFFLYRFRPLSPFVRLLSLVGRLMSSLQFSGVEHRSWERQFRAIEVNDNKSKETTPTSGY